MFSQKTQIQVQLKKNTVFQLNVKDRTGWNWNELQTSASLQIHVVDMKLRAK